MAAYLAVCDSKRRFIKRSRRNPLDMDDDHIISEYTLNKEAIAKLCESLEEDLKRKTKRSNALSVEEQVLISLKVLASGSFQNCAKDYINVAQQTVSVVLQQFLDALFKRFKQHICMPSTQQKIEYAKQQFFSIAQFPRVIGAIAGTHIPIIAPQNDEHIFMNKKGFHSIKVLAICDANMVFRGVVARWPGSNDDSFCLEYSTVTTVFETGHFGSSVLLGGSGYPLKKWLMTPLSNPESEPELRYNRAHKKSRACIERAFGVLKQRWRILDPAGRKPGYSPQKTALITICCCILHNICLQNRIPFIAGTNDEGRITVSQEEDDDSTVSEDEDDDRTASEEKDDDSTISEEEDDYSTNTEHGDDDAQFMRQSIIDTFVA